MFRKSKYITEKEFQEYKNRIEDRLWILENPPRFNIGDKVNMNPEWDDKWEVKIIDHRKCGNYVCDYLRFIYWEYAIETPNGIEWYAEHYFKSK
jgi:hypothetical protein